MSEDVSAGALRLEAYVDTTGVGKGLQRKIDREVAGIRANIKAEIDARGMAAQARTAAKAAASAAVVKLQTSIDSKSAVAQARAAAAAASKAAVVKMRTEVDKASAAVSEKRIGAVAADQTSTINVDADTAKADAAIAATKAKAAAATVGVGVPAAGAAGGGGGDGGMGLPDMVGAASDANDLAAALTGPLTKIPMVVGGFATLASGAIQLAGGLVALTSSIGAVAGGLAILPNLAGVAAQGIGVLVAGFSGIGDAVTELGETEIDAAASVVTDAGEAARAAAEAVADAQWALARSAESIRDSREALADARDAAADSAEDSADRIAAAEEAVRDAHSASKDAQEALNDARVAARDRIRDLNMELMLSAGREEEAAAAVQRAREDLQDVKWDLAASPQERRDAEMALQSAQNGLKEIRVRNNELAEDTKKANKEGVKGSDEVASARDAIQATIEAERDAVENLADAREAAAEAAVSSARAIRDAEENVRDALHAQQEAREGLADAQRSQKDAADNLTAALEKQNEAMDNLTPAGQRFARFIANVLKPRLTEIRKAIQDAFLPPLQAGIKASMPLFDTLQAGVTETAEILGKGARRMGRMFGKDIVNNNIEDIMESNNVALTDFMGAGRALLRVLIRLAKVAGPTLLEPFAKWVRKLTEGWAAATDTKEEMEGLSDTFDNVRERVKRLWSVLTNITDVLWDIGKAATPSGDKLMKMLDATTQKWSEWTSSDAGEERMGKFFEATEEVTAAFGDLITEITEFFFKLSEGGNLPIVIFLEALTGALKGVNAAMSIPGVAEAVGLLLGLAAIGGALGFVAGKIMGIGTGLGKLAKVTGLSKLKDSLWGVKGEADGTGKTVGKLQEKFLSAKKKAIDLAKTLKGKVVDGLKSAGKKSVDVAKDLGSKFVAGAKKAGKATVDWAKEMKGQAVEALNKARDAALDNAKTLKDKFTTAVGKAKTAVLQKAAVLKAQFLKAMTAAKVAILKGVAAAKKWIIEQVKAKWASLKATAALVKQKIATALATAKMKAQIAITKAMTIVQKLLNRAMLMNPIGIVILAILALIAVFVTLYKKNEAFRKLVDKVWAAIKSAVVDTWNDHIKPALQNLADFITKDIPDAFAKGLKFINDFWEGLKDAAANPVKFVVDTVWNDGLRRVINAIPGIPDMDEIDTSSWASGTANILPGHTPGRDVHSFFSPTGGRLNLSGGEAVMRPEFTQALGARGVDFLNRAARSGRKTLSRAIGSFAGAGMSYASGGTIGSAPTTGTMKDEEEGNFLTRWKNAIGTVKDFMGKVPGMLSTLAQMSPFALLIKAGVQAMGGDVVGWINDKIPNKFLPDNPIPNVFDRGGEWLSGTMGVNLSGQSETVFTNQNIVDVTHDLAVLSKSLRGMLQPALAGGGSGALVENLTLIGRDDERERMLRQTREELRVIRMGGVHSVRPR